MSGLLGFVVKGFEIEFLVVFYSWIEGLDVMGQQTSVPGKVLGFRV